MPDSLAFILGLLDRSFPAFVSAEDVGGEHGPALRLWQRLGFLSCDPEAHPVPSCPSCQEGTPFLLGGRHVCGACQSTVDPRHLLRWRFDLDAILTWLAGRLRLTGGVRHVADDRLWELGSFTRGDVRAACFFCRGGPLPERGRVRLLAFKDAVLLRPVPRAETTEGFHGASVSLLELLRQDCRSLRLADPLPLLHGAKAVRFDEGSGALWAGTEWLGEVPAGSKEYHLLARLAREQDRFVPYSDLKHAVLRATGGRDGTDEATFCQKLKLRLKAAVPTIDRLIVTTNKGHGYRLRAHVGR